MFNWSDEILAKHNIVQITPSLYDLLVYSPSQAPYGLITKKIPSFVLFVYNRKNFTEKDSQMMEAYEFLWQFRKNSASTIDVTFVDIGENEYLKETFDVRREFEVRFLKGSQIYDFQPDLIWSIKDKFEPELEDKPFDFDIEATNFEEKEIVENESVEIESSENKEE